MAHGYDTMMNPAIEDLLEETGSKFRLVSLSAMRSREITNYVGQLGQGIGASVPPQVTSTAAKPLSIAFEEIAAEKIAAIRFDPDAEAEAVALAEAEALAAAETGDGDKSA